MSETACELTWMNLLLRDLGIPQHCPAVLYGDNLSSIYLTANPVLQPRSKHFEVDYHFVREKVALGSIVVKHIPASQQLANIFTKSLSHDAFVSLRYKLGVHPSPTPSLKGAVKENKAKENKVEEECKESLSLTKTLTQP